jgi:hypothetical protein
MTKNKFKPMTEQFAANYKLVQNAEIMTYPGEKARMDEDMHEALVKEFGQYFMGMIGGLHYQFISEKTIPMGRVAVPEDGHDDPDALLIRDE